MAKTYVNENGYRCFSNSGKQVSRWVAEKKIGRPLQKSEVVHHGSKGKGCNSRSNLTVFKSQSEHMRKAHSKRWCKRVKRRELFYKNINYLNYKEK